MNAGGESEHERENRLKLYYTALVAEKWNGSAAFTAERNMRTELFYQWEGEEQGAGKI